MTARAALEEINRNLKHIRREIVIIREHMVDIDSIMSLDDKLALNKARKELSESKAITITEFEKQLNLA